MRTARALLLALACCAVVVLPACARRTAAPPALSEPSRVSAMVPANRLDLSLAEKTVVAYIAAMRSRDATAAAALMTRYRRAETASPSWKSSIAGWRTARVRTVAHPGRYISDERSFAELYANRFGHEPYKLVVLNVTYSRGPGEPLGSTDFVVIQDKAHTPWLINDFGGAPQAGN